MWEQPRTLSLVNCIQFFSNRSSLALPAESHHVGTDSRPSEKNLPLYYYEMLFSTTPLFAAFVQGTPCLAVLLQVPRQSALSLPFPFGEH